MQNLRVHSSTSKERESLIKNFREMQEEFMIIRDHLLRREGIPKPGGFLLRWVDTRGPMKLTNCSLDLGVSKPTVTKIVDNLQKRGLVERVREGKDRRSYYIHLTTKGAEVLKRTHAAYDEVLNKVVTSLSAEEARAFNSSLVNFNDKLHSAASELISGAA